jgi:hypothetical protein
VAAPARTAAQSAVNKNRSEAAKPQTTVCHLPGLKLQLVSEAPENQRRSPPQVIHHLLAPATEEATNSGARKRTLQSQRRQSVQWHAARRINAASSSRVSCGEVTVTTQVIRKAPRFGNTMTVVFGVQKQSSPPRRVLPNPSFKRTPNGVARQPSSAGASPHFALGVRRATPPGSA